MALRLVIAPRAQADLRDVAEYIAKEDPGAALRILVRTEKSIERLLERPFLGPAVVRPPRRDLRKLTIAPYIVFYRVAGAELQVVRLLHSSRDVDDVLLNDRP